MEEKSCLSLLKMKNFITATLLSALATAANLGETAQFDATTVLAEVNAQVDASCPG